MIVARTCLQCAATGVRLRLVLGHHYLCDACAAKLRAELTPPEEAATRAQAVLEAAGARASRVPRPSTDNPHCVCGSCARRDRCDD